MESTEQDNNSSLWQYVTILDKRSAKGGNKRFRCNFCNSEFTGSYSRVKAHLLKISGFGIKKCPKVSNDKHNELLAKIEEVDQRKVSHGHQSFSSCPKVSNDKHKEILAKIEKVDQPKVLLGHQSVTSASSTTPMHIGGGSESVSQPTTYQTLLKNVEMKKRKTTQKETHDLVFDNECRETLNSHIARMFYAGGLSFHFARNPYYLRAISYAANNNLKGFIPPGYNSLRTTLLQKEKENIDRLLQPIKETWSENGISIVTNGWSDVQQQPIINFMAVTESGPIFIKNVNCEGKNKDNFFIVSLMNEVITEVGAHNVVQVIIDSAFVCKAARVLEAQYSHIFWTPCVVHILDLVLKNICNPSPPRPSSIYDATFDQCKWITEVYNDAMLVKNFIMNRGMRSTIFNEFASLKLLLVAEPRFASVVIVLKRFKLIKYGLQSMVISNSWTHYRENDPDKAQAIKKMLLNDLWWDKITYILNFTRPI